MIANADRRPDKAFTPIR
nr:hypothetical protein [Escherichia coli]